MTWPFEDDLQEGVPLPKAFYVDYGVPQEVCWEASPGVFRREWTKASIELNCESFVAQITLKQQQQQQPQEVV